MPNLPRYAQPTDKLMPTFTLFQLFGTFKERFELLLKATSNPVDINLEIVNQFCQNTGLYFKTNSSSPQVCYAESDEISADFKLFFTREDLTAYCLAQVFRAAKISSTEITLPLATALPYPTTADYFSQFYRLGKIIRHALMQENSPNRATSKSITISKSTALISLRHQLDKL